MDSGYNTLILLHGSSEWNDMNNCFKQKEESKQQSKATEKLKKLNIS